MVAVLAWLEKLDRKVQNGSRPLQLKISKLAQYSSLIRQGDLSLKQLSQLEKTYFIKSPGF